MSHIRIAACALALALSSGLAASADTVKGTALYRERIMPPPDARFQGGGRDVPHECRAVGVAALFRLAESR